MASNNYTNATVHVVKERWRWPGRNNGEDPCPPGSELSHTPETFASQGLSNLRRSSFLEKCVQINYKVKGPKGGRVKRRAPGCKYGKRWSNSRKIFVCRKCPRGRRWSKKVNGCVLPRNPRKLGNEWGTHCMTCGIPARPSPRPTGPRYPPGMVG